VRKLSSNAAIPDKFCGTISPDDWKEKKGDIPSREDRARSIYRVFVKTLATRDRFSQAIPECAAVAAAIGRSRPYSKIPFVGLREAGLPE
jgi:hypothetical protein